MELSTDNGSDGDDYTNTCFTPTAMDSIQTGQAPFSGSFIPEGSWSVFENTPINGEWNLLVSDGSGQNELGRLISWSITFNTQNEIRYEWVPNQNISCNDCSMPIFSPDDTTPYTLILSDNYGQEYRDTFLLSVSSQPCSFQECTLMGQVLEVIPPSCSSSIDGQLKLTAGGGAGPYEFRINGSLITGDTVTFTSIPAGDQLLTITDQASCVDTLMVSIPLPADALRLNLLVDQELSCSDARDGVLLGNVQGGQGPYQFDWPGLSSTTNSVENVGAGTYLLRVQDNNGCVVEDTVELIAPLPLVLDFDIQQPLCSNTQDGVLTVLPLGGEGPYSYQWIDGQTTEQISMLGNGQYQISVTDSRGCEQTATAELMAPPGLQIDSIIANPVNCFGGSSGSAQIFASGGTGKYLYQWDDPNGQVDSIATGLMSGTYNVSVADENGCELTSEIMISEPAPLSVELTPTDVQCKGIADGSVRTRVSGGTMPYQYSWSNQQTTPDLQNLNSGSYRLTITDANGCQIQGAAMVAEPNVGLSLTIDQVQRGCNGKKSNSARVNTSGGNGPFTYLWSDGQNTQLATGLDSLMYTVQVTDVSGCFSLDSIKIQDLEPIVPNIIISPPSCRGAFNGALGINFVEGGSNAALEDYTFVWSNGATGPFVDGLIGGETYVVTVTDPAGCQATARRTVTIGQGIRYDTVVTPVRCFEERSGKIELTNIQGQGSDYLIRWDVVSGGSGTTAENLAAGTYSFTITDEANCSQEATIRVPQPAPILINFNTQDIDCFSNTGGSVAALIQGGTGPYQYLWSNQDTTASIGDLSAGTYTLSVTDQNGCQQERSTTIDQPSSFETRFTTKMPTCQGDRNGSITVAVEGGSPPYQFSLDNQSFQPSNAFLGLFANTYTVFIKDRNSCTLFETVTLEDPAPLEIQASPKNAKIRIGESIQLQANNINGAGNIQFYWKAPYEGTLSCQMCTNPIAAPQNTITYELIGTDENGCTASDFLSVFVQKPKIILVPTGFTPNYDGLNDGLIVHGEAETLIRSFQVFDRWGSLIFEAVNFMANDEENAWNGRYKNQEAGNGVYIWVVEAEFVDGSTEVFKGQTSLIR
jgi:gliding motility-associated-like protein